MAKVNAILEGTVKFFIENKGYGFIIPEKNGIDEVFFHHTNASSKLGKGDKVTFELEEGKRGLKAINVEKYK